MEDKEELLKIIKDSTGAESVDFIELDDSFGFKCQQCGKCCMNREDIILNPFDVYNGARHLGITCQEFIMQYTHIEVGSHSKIPMVLLRTSKNGFCPLLKFDIKDGGKFKCMIHEAKPGACANHPIGVLYGYAKNSDGGAKDIQFIKVDQCDNSASDEQHTVREWIKPYLEHQEEIESAHQIQSLATKYFDTRKFWFIAKTVQLLGELPGDEMPEMKDLPYNYLSQVIGITYANYDTSKPFIEQVEVNTKLLDEFFTHTKDLYEKLDVFFKNLMDTPLGETIKKHFEELEEV